MDRVLAVVKHLGHQPPVGLVSLVLKAADLAPVLRTGSPISRQPRHGVSRQLRHSGQNPDLSPISAGRSSMRYSTIRSAAACIRSMQSSSFGSQTVDVPRVERGDERGVSP